MTVSEVHQAAGLTSLMFWIGFGCSVVCIGKMCLSLTYKLPYAVVAGCITVHLIGGCLVGLGSVNFIVASADLRKLLESDSVIPDTAPELVFPGYSAFLALSRCLPSGDSNTLVRRVQSLALVTCSLSFTVSRPSLYLSSCLALSL